SPIMSEPLLAGSMPPSSSFAGRLPPSYHVSVSAGRLPRAGNQYLMIDHFGYMILLWPDDSASTAIGSRKSRAMNGWLSVWQAMSPRAPVPKSQKPRQANGW